PDPATPPAFKSAWPAAGRQFPLLGAFGSGFAEFRLNLVNVSDNTAPALTRKTSALTVNEGALATNAGTFGDAQGRGTVTLTASLGTPIQDNATGTWTWTYTPPDGPTGPTTVTITATDSGGLSSAISFSMTVHNLAPSLTTLTAPPAAAEGSAVSLSAAATDPAGANDPLTFTWTITRPDNSTFTLTGPSVSFTPTDNGNYGVSLAVRDDDGGVTTDSRTLTVTNVARAVNVVGPAGGLPGQALAVTVAAADPSVTDQAAPVVSTVDWGDGSAVQAVAGPASGARLQHAYAAAGAFVVSVTATDKD